MIDDTRWHAFCEKREAIERETARWKAFWVRPHEVPKEEQEAVLGRSLEREHSLFDLLRRPNVSYGSLLPWLQGSPERVVAAVSEQIEISAKYAGYIDRQKLEVENQLAQEARAIPGDLDYASVRGLSKEVQQKLAQHRPETVGQAGRIQGVTPAAISLLLVHLKRREGAARIEQSA